MCGTTDILIWYGLYKLYNVLPAIGILKRFPGTLSLEFKPYGIQEDAWKYLKAIPICLGNWLRGFLPNTQTAAATPTENPAHEIKTLLFLYKYIYN